jgi:hypothetical protein
MRKEITYLRAQVSEFRLASLYWRERSMERSREPATVGSWDTGVDAQHSGSGRAAG